MLEENVRQFLPQTGIDLHRHGVTNIKIAVQIYAKNIFNNNIINNNNLINFSFVSVNIKRAFALN